MDRYLPWNLGERNCSSSWLFVKPLLKGDVSGVLGESLRRRMVGRVSGPLLTHVVQESRHLGVPVVCKRYDFCMRYWSHI